jgi:hypothetical protein
VLCSNTTMSASPAVLQAQPGASTAHAQPVASAAHSWELSSLELIDDYGVVARLEPPFDPAVREYRLSKPLPVDVNDIEIDAIAADTAATVWISRVTSADARRASARAATCHPTSGASDQCRREEAHGTNYDEQDVPFTGERAWFSTPTKKVATPSRSWARAYKAADTFAQLGTERNALLKEAGFLVARTVKEFLRGNRMPLATFIERVAERDSVVINGGGGRPAAASVDAKGGGGDAKGSGSDAKGGGGGGSVEWISFMSELRFLGLPALSADDEGELRQAVGVGPAEHRVSLESLRGFLASHASESHHARRVVSVREAVDMVPTDVGVPLEQRQPPRTLSSQWAAALAITGESDQPCGAEAGARLEEEEEGRETSLRRQLRDLRDAANDSKHRLCGGTYRICVQPAGADVAHQLTTYVVDLLTTPRPSLPPPPAALDDLLVHLYGYYGGEYGSLRGRTLAGASVGVPLDRFLALCEAMKLVAPAIARAAFDQVTDHTRDAALDLKQLWLCLWFCVVRSRTAQPLVVKSSQDWAGCYDEEKVLGTVLDALLPFAYNMRGASFIAASSAAAPTPRRQLAMEARVLPRHEDEASIQAERESHNSTLSSLAQPTVASPPKPSPSTQSDIGQHATVRTADNGSAHSYCRLQRLVRKEQADTSGLQAAARSADTGNKHQQEEPTPGSEIDDDGDDGGDDDWTVLDSTIRGRFPGSPSQRMAIHNHAHDPEGDEAHGAGSADMARGVVERQAEQATPVTELRRASMASTGDLMGGLIRPNPTAEFYQGPPEGVNILGMFESDVPYDGASCGLGVVRGSPRDCHSAAESTLQRTLKRTPPSCSLRVTHAPAYSATASSLRRAHSMAQRDSQAHSEPGLRRPAPAVPAGVYRLARSVSTPAAQQRPTHGFQVPKERRRRGAQPPKTVSLASVSLFHPRVDQSALLSDEKPRRRQGGRQHQQSLQHEARRHPLATSGLARNATQPALRAESVASSAEESETVVDSQEAMLPQQVVSPGGASNLDVASWDWMAGSKEEPVSRMGSNASTALPLPPPERFATSGFTKDYVRHMNFVWARGLGLQVDGRQSRDPWAGQTRNDVSAAERDAIRFVSYPIGSNEEIGEIAWLVTSGAKRTHALQSATLHQPQPKVLFQHEPLRPPRKKVAFRGPVEGRGFEDIDAVEDSFKHTPPNRHGRCERCGQDLTNEEARTHKCPGKKLQWDPVPPLKRYPTLEGKEPPKEEEWDLGPGWDKAVDFPLERGRKGLRRGRRRDEGLAGIAVAALEAANFDRAQTEVVVGERVVLSARKLVALNVVERKPFSPIDDILSPLGHTPPDVARGADLFNSPRLSPRVASRASSPSRTSERGGSPTASASRSSSPGWRSPQQFRESAFRPVHPPTLNPGPYVPKPLIGAFGGRALPKYTGEPAESISPRLKLGTGLARSRDHGWDGSNRVV